MEDEIGNALGIAPIQGEIVEDVVKYKKTVKTESSDEENDYKYARDNFYNVIEKGTDALEQMLDVAKASEHPRAYEVVATLMKTLVDANKDLVSMGEKKAKDKENGDGQSNKAVTNNLFVGSTSELQKMLKELKNEDS